MLCGESVAVSLWEPVAASAPPSDAETHQAYVDLRRCLDSFPGALPEFREAIARAMGPLDAANLHDPALLTILSRLRRACIVVWCSARKCPGVDEADATAYHLEDLWAEASGQIPMVPRPTA